MLFGLFRFDWTILIVLPALIISIWAQFKVKSTFDEYSQLYTRHGMTGASAARRILDANGLYDVNIERVRGNLTDHYDPRANVIRLSDSVHDSRSTAAIGVAAHEAGHAVQYAQSYFPIKVRSAAIPMTRIGSMLSIPLFFIGLLLASDYLMLIGIVFYASQTYRSCGRQKQQTIIVVIKDNYVNKSFRGCVPRICELFHNSTKPICCVIPILLYVFYYGEPYESKTSCHQPFAKG